MKLKKIPLTFLCLYFVIFCYAQDPFTCDGAVYFAKSNGTDSKISQIHFNWEDGEVSQTGLSGSLGYSSVRVLGYNLKDNFIYGIAYEDNLYYLIKIDNDGNAITLVPLDIDQTKWDVGGGDITKEGIFTFSLARSTSPMPNDPSGAIGKIDLNTADYDLSIVPFLSQIGEAGFFIADMVFDPITDSLYAHTTGQTSGSLERRMLFIDINTPSINDTFFPTDLSFVTNITPFFDTFGNLWGINYWLMFRIDKNTGIIEQKPGASTFYVSEVCSCPYTLGMQKTVSQDTVYPCAEVLYTIKISNLAKDLQEQISFRDSLPEGFEVLEVVHNPYSGVISGLGNNELTISNMDIPYGVDSIIVKVLVPEDADGLYLNQAQLSNVDLSAGNNPESVILSDYPFTGEKNDATPLFVEPLEIDLSGDIFELCPDSTITLNPFSEIEGVEYLWSTGSTEPILNITEAGDYGVTVTVNCLKDSAIFEVFLSKLSVDLGGSEEIIYGDFLEIEALVLSVAPLSSYIWQTPDTIICADCPNIEITPQKSDFIELTVNNEAGCFASDSKFILVERPVYVPNVFSPNYDGINDVFYIQTKHPVQIKKWQIFNRWGDLIFAKSNIFTNDISEAWDGRFKGEPLEKGIYVWQLELEYLNGDSVFLSGDVLILSD